MSWVLKKGLGGILMGIITMSFAIVLLVLIEGVDK